MAAPDARALPICDVLIFHKAGRVLWRRTREALSGDPVSTLIGAYLLEEKGGGQSARVGDYAMHWRAVNDADLVVVVTSHASLELDFCGDLAEAVRRRVAASGGAKTPEAARALAATFDGTYDAIEREMDARLRVKRKQKAQLAEARREKRAEAAARKAEAEAEAEEAEEEAPEEDAAPDDGAAEDPLAKLKRRGAGSKSTSGGRRKGKKKPAAADDDDKKGGPKKPTVWRDGSQRNKKATAKEVAALDRSGPAGDSAAADARRQAEMRDTYLPSAGENAAWDEEEALVALEDEAADPAKPRSWFARNVGGLLQNVAGTQTLQRDQVDPVMEQLRQRLMAKNVAVEVADAITQSVAESVVGRAVERFSSAGAVVRDALARAVERVLTPKRSTDVLRAVLDSKAKRRGPYSIVFVGINGVGKSTSLSKVAYYLKQHGVDVMITACDTFRSGAVEQLRSHARCLDVELFEKGYLKDPADVARASLEHARQQKKECVLIDTAGRMQNNDKLMRELAKLISVNSPDLVLFVGEALVGNDGIDQLNMFNESLARFCDDGRQIDGLVLTKFDTIDDKVGATLSMTYKTGQPIVFIGVGQKYTHLKKLSVNAIVNSLFS